MSEIRRPTRVNLWSNYGNLLRRLRNHPYIRTCHLGVEHKIPDGQIPDQAFTKIRTLIVPSG
jgi:hypothetical protein